MGVGGLAVVVRWLGPDVAGCDPNGSEASGGWTET
jgi:hypothetical protein